MFDDPNRVLNIYLQCMWLERSISVVANRETRWPYDPPLCYNIAYICIKVCKTSFFSFSHKKISLVVCRERWALTKNIKKCLNRRKDNIDEARLRLVYPKSLKGIRWLRHLLAFFARALFPWRSLTPLVKFPTACH